MTFFTSHTTWLIITMFVTGGLEAVGIIPNGLAVTIMGFIGAGGLIGHNIDIKTGRVK